MRRKPLLITLAIALLIGGSIGGWILTQPKQSTTPADTTYPVAVTKLDKTPKQLTDAQLAMIKSYVSATVTAKHGEGSYDATYREGSYKRTVTPQGGIITTVLIDVASTKETYLVTWTGGDNDRNSTSYVRCAPEADQYTHPSACKELADD